MNNNRISKPKKVQIAFLGTSSSFDYYQIGGVESFIRRLALELGERYECRTCYILYGANKTKQINVMPSLQLKYFKRFKNALNAIDGPYEHVVTTYLLPQNRLKYASFRKERKDSTCFHFIYFSWPGSLIRRKLYFGEAKLFPYNGKLFSISQRQYKLTKRWADNSVHILPPVPEAYFLRPEEKPLNKKIKTIFMGRVDQGKGINEVIEIFKALKENNKFECCIYGIHIQENNQSLMIHDQLKKQNDIEYIEINRQKYSLNTEEFVNNVLRRTDILLLPYHKLSSSIDTPLLVLEAMASLCPVISKPFENILQVYGHSKFLISDKNFVSSAQKLLENISLDDVISERQRLHDQNKKLSFNAADVAKNFLDAIGK